MLSTNSISKVDVFLLFSLIPQECIVQRYISLFVYKIFQEQNFYVFQAEDRPWPDRQWGLCIFDDVLEHYGPVSIV